MPSTDIGACAQGRLYSGNTQSQRTNSFASNVGPLTLVPRSRAPKAKASASRQLFLDEDNGISFALATFANNQRMFSIYDGPLTRIPTPISISRAANHTQRRGHDATRNLIQIRPPPQLRQQRLFAPARCWGMLTTQLIRFAICLMRHRVETAERILFPPAFHSDNLFFNNVDIRHFVIEPLFQVDRPVCKRSVQSRIRILYL